MFSDLNTGFQVESFLYYYPRYDLSAHVIFHTVNTMPDMNYVPAVEI